MKALNIKSILIAAVAATSFGAGSALAVPMSDQFLKAYDSANSGSKTELGFLEDATGLDFGDTALRNIDGKGGATYDKLAKLWVINVAPNEPGYFLLKFGLGKNRHFKTSLDTYVFRNSGDLTQLVWANSAVNFLSGGDCTTKPTDGPCNIDRLSHISWVPGGGTGDPDEHEEVPEPVSLALLGAGLAAIALRRRS